MWDRLLVMMASCGNVGHFVKFATANIIIIIHLRTWWCHRHGCDDDGVFEYFLFLNGPKRIPPVPSIIARRTIDRLVLDTYVLYKNVDYTTALYGRLTIIDYLLRLGLYFAAIKSGKVLAATTTSAIISKKKFYVWI